MTKITIRRKLAVSAVLISMWVMPYAVLAQTQIKPGKNKYKVQDDVKLGNDAAREVEKQFPLLSDADATRYLERVGSKLVVAIPAQFRQPAFDYRFKIVNASDLNAFALPGGPMFVNRGMIQAAKNEGELAGVMAHEISHVALRHATAQATKQGSLGNQLGVIGMILGGAILGGQAGAELGAMGAMAWMTKFSRAAETQADTLGAQIMADAGYDPIDLANVFKTLQSQEGGNRVPQWMSSHPDPGNRYENIKRETALLRVSSNPIKMTRDLERIQSRFRSMPRAKTMAEIEKDAKSGQGTTPNPTAGGRYSNSVEFPSSRVRAYSSGNWIRLNVPSNWKEFPGENEVQFAPDGAYGDQGITHGAMLGLYRGQSSDLAGNSDEYVDGILQGNTYLSKRSGFSRTTVAGKQGYSIVLAGRSPITGRTEVVTVYTVQLSSGDMLYVATVVPDNESTSYYNAFRNMLNSIRLNY